MTETVRIKDALVEERNIKEMIAGFRVWVLPDQVNECAYNEGKNDKSERVKEVFDGQHECGRQA